MHNVHFIGLYPFELFEVKSERTPPEEPEGLEAPDDDRRLIWLDDGTGCLHGIPGDHITLEGRRTVVHGENGEILGVFPEDWAVWMERND